jgi:signal transduction histidine kinase
MLMQGGPVIELKSRRFLDLTTYAVIGVMYLLGARHIADPRARLLAAVLCIGFALNYALLLHRERAGRNSVVYFAVQTLLVSSLLAMSADGWDFFAFLFFVLSIHAAVIFPTRIAAGWIALFYAIVAFSYVAFHGSEDLVPLYFDAAVFLLCAVFGSNLRQTELALRHNKQLVAELQDAQRQLQEMAVSAERNRLAREIHDGLGHYLTATTMQIQGARALLANTSAGTQAPAALDALGKAETLLQEALADIRRSVSALRATSVESQPLEPALRQLVDECQSWTGLDARLEVRGVQHPLGPQVELALYRVAQEGLTNVRKHAHAAHVNVTLDYAPTKVCLSICDDGAGSDATQGGFGLLGLRERVELLRGTVKTVSSPGQGFRLEVEIPV